jgi:hypothetical protein
LTFSRSAWVAAAVAAAMSWHIAAMPATLWLRSRRILVLRYHLQTQGQSGGIPEEVVARLSPETVELISPAGPTDVKDIVHRDVVELS